MKTSQVQFAAVVVVLLVLGLSYPLFVGGSTPQVEDEPPEIVYVDTKSGKAFLLASRDSPAENPETGEMTVVPGMYCTDCNAWIPVGSLDFRQTKRFTRMCPIHKIPLVRDGPEPE